MKIISRKTKGLLFLASAVFTVNAVNADSGPVEKQLELGNFTLQFTEAGAGDTIVAIHGAVSDKRVWDSYQQPLSDQHHLVTYTRRYYGTQPWPEGENVYDASVHAEDLAALIRATNSAPVNLIARSSGGYSAVITAVKYPELVKSLVLWEPFVGNDFVPSAGFDDKSVELINAFRKGFGPAAKAAKSGDTNTAVEHFIEHVYEMEKGSFHELSDSYKELFYDNARTLSLLYTGKTTDKVTCDFLGKIQAPTLVLRGSDTDEGYAMTHIKAAECIPGSQLSVIEGVVHDGAGKKVAEISQRAQEFWRTVK